MFVNIYTPEECRVWLRLDFGCMDLDLSHCRAGRIGAHPEWFDEEMYNSGWDLIVSGSGIWEEKGRWTMWALREGLCPGQPFYVSVHPPRWFQCGGYEYPNEWDCEWDWDIVAKMPQDPVKAARVWGRWFTEQEETRVAIEKDKVARAYRRAHALDSMQIQYDGYWSSYYDEMSPPDGVIVRLISTLDYYEVLAEGRGDRQPGHDGNRKKAWENLLARVAEDYPHLSPEFVRNLPTRWC